MDLLLLRSFEALLEASGYAALIGAAVGFLQWLLGGKLSPGWRGAMWMLVLVRLILPVAPHSRLSAYNLFNVRPQPAAVKLADDGRHVVVFGSLPPAGLVLHRTESAVRTPSSSVDWRIVVAGVWLCVALGLLVRVVIANLLLRRRLMAAGSCRDVRLLNLLENCRAELDAPRVRLIEADEDIGVALFGAFRPILILPRNLASRLSESELRFIFLHELTHAGRRDLLIYWLVLPTCILHWFNPVAWLAAGRFRAQRRLGM